MLNAIIIDDEPLARKGLREYMADIDFLHCLGEFENPLQASAVLATGECHLIFLDIQMPKLSGLDFLRTMKNLPPVILTTAYPQYAVEGFELDVLDYLVKPISFDRFLKAALKAKEYDSLRRETTAEKLPGTAAAGPDHFFVKTDGQLVKIALADIVFVEALQNYISIQTTGKKYMTYLTFKSVEDYLPATQFVKVHKSYLVSAAHITGIDGNEVVLGTHRIPISRTLKDQVMEQLVNAKWLKR